MNTPINLDHTTGLDAATDTAVNSSILFTSFTDGADTNMLFDWTNEPLAALEPLDDVLLNQHQSCLGIGPEEDLSPARSLLQFRLLFLPVREQRQIHDGFDEWWQSYDKCPGLRCCSRRLRPLPWRYRATGDVLQPCA
jgi:hypothetical protein